MRKIEENFINHTLEFWQKQTPQKLSYEDARQIIANVTGFFEVLSKWERSERNSGYKNTRIFMKQEK